MATFSEMLARWPDLRVLERDLGVPYHTISAWKRRGSVPDRYFDALARSAAAHGIKGVTLKTLQAARAQVHAAHTKTAAQPPPPDCPAPRRKPAAPAA